MAVVLLTRGTRGLGYLDIKQVDPAVGLDKAFAQVLIFVQQMVRFHLRGGLALASRFGCEPAGLLQHLHELADVACTAGRAQESLNGADISPLR